MVNWKTEFPEIHNVQQKILFLEKLERFKDKPNNCQLCGFPFKELELVSLGSPFSSNPDDYMYICEKCIYRMNERKMLIDLKDGIENEL